MAASATADAAPLNAVGSSEKDLYGISFAVGKSRRYHQRRRAFFDAMDRTVKVASAVTGAGAFVALVGDATVVAQISALAVFVLSIFDVVVSFSTKARHHEMLYRAFSALAEEIEGTLSPGLEQVARWRARRTAIERDEGPVLGVLDDLCYNEEANARGKDWQVPLTGLQILFRHVSDLPPYDRPPGPRRRAE